MNKSPIKTSNILALILLVWGLTAMLGEIFGVKSLKGIGLASCAAPYTKVFCQARSIDEAQPFETFAADFIIHYQLQDGEQRSLPITPEIYQNLQGPYQRRNVYGAVLAYGPALPKATQQRTFSYALESPGSIADELGLPPNTKHISVEMISRSKNSSHRWMLEGLHNQSPPSHHVQ